MVRRGTQVYGMHGGKQMHFGVRPGLKVYAAICRG